MEFRLVEFISQKWLADGASFISIDASSSAFNAVFGEAAIIVQIRGRNSIGHIWAQGEAEI